VVFLGRFFTTTVRCGDISKKWTLFYSSEWTWSCQRICSSRKDVLLSGLYFSESKYQWHQL